ncbi:MAG TPA: CsgG/HfaB family protein [Gemmatimonadales bacterium]|nr:CsgG/HfaB family protein [Gemmatimonadales bacterium]
MKRPAVSLLACAFALAFPLPAQQPGAPAAAPKKKIVVLDFDYSQARAGVQDVFGSDQDIGKAIADLVSAALTKDGSYDVGPRQNIGAAQRTDPNAAAQLAKQLGVDAVVMGTVTAYGKQEAQQGGVNVRVGGFGGMLGKNKTTAMVGLSAQFIAAPSPAPLAYATGNGTASGSGKSLLGDANVAGISANGNLNLGNSSYGKSTIGKANQQAVDDLVAQLLAAYSKLAPPAPPVAAAPAMPSAPPAPAAPLPAAYAQPVSGPFMWGLYNFRGTEHMKYNVTLLDEGQTKTGVWTLDASKSGANIQLNVQWTLGADAGSGTLILQPGQMMISPMELVSLGPAGALVFNPGLGFLVMGHQWQVGTGWSYTHEGKTASFAVDATCSGAGVSGVHGVMKENAVPIWDLCVSPNVGLPLDETFNNDDGSGHFKMTLVEFRP